MGFLQLRELGLAPLFENLTLSLSGGDRLGLVAGNGAGKSSLLRCLAGLQEPGSGSITRSRGLRIGLLEQEMPANLLPLTLAEAVRRAIPPAQRAAEAWRAELALDAFETPSLLRETPVQQLSGGWQRLALIARIQVAEPDLLLLDEPTNHLDLGKIALLEDWINQAVPGLPMVIASHDRSFLDACTGRTLFLRPGVSRHYPQPFGQARALLAQDDGAEAAQHARELGEAGRLRRSAASLKNIGVNSRSDAALRKSTQLARRAGQLEDSLRPAHREKSGAIRLASSDLHAKRLASFADVTVATPEGRPLFRTGRLEIRQRERLVLLGPNGAGKSRFLALLRQALAAPDGLPGVQTSPAVVPGYLDQQMGHLPAEATPHGFVSTRFRQEDARARSLLAAAGIGVEAQQRPIGALSPGQRSRLGLLALRLTAPNFYILDEPTNHLDIAGQEALEAEILAQDAACLLVSHDRRFMARLGTRFLRIERGALQELDGPPGAW